MKKMLKTIGGKGLFLLALFVIMAVSGCSSLDRELQGQRDPKELFDKGMASYSAEKYDEAEKYLKKLMEDHPLNPLSVEAQLVLGDLYYVTEKYDEAGSYYTNFYALHPSHPRASYALFQKGMSHFRDVLTMDRDQTSTRKALFAFQDLLATPDSAYHAKARELVAFLRKRLAERELYVANFYYRNKNYKGALSRYRDLLKDYPDAGFTDRALYYVGESYIRLGQKKLADEAFTTLLSDYPQSPLAGSARTRLNES